MTGEDVLAYYAEDREDERLLAAPLEFERMKRGLLEVAELEEDEHLLTVSPHLLAVGVVP